MELTLNNLRNLTPKQCVELAIHLYPEYKWRFVESIENPWDGYDVISGNLPHPDATLQIDFRDQLTQEYGRVRFYDNQLNSYIPDTQSVVNYFESIDYPKNINKKVYKKSKKPFKSGFHINTVKGIIQHPILNKPAYIFIEDDSYVDCRICKEINL